RSSQERLCAGVRSDRSSEEVGVRIAVTGATGVLGQEAVEALVAAGHEVTGITRRDSGVPIIEGRGGSAIVADVFDRSDLTRAFRGHDVAVNALAHVPVGMSGLRPLAWREDDRLHLEASVAIAEAAAESGVRRLIQESTIYLYPDHGAEWISEDLPLSVRNQAYRPRGKEMRAAVDFATAGRSAVILRLGQLLGRDQHTTHALKAAPPGDPLRLGERGPRHDPPPALSATRHGQPILRGSPDHPSTLRPRSDAGRAFGAALPAGSGFYTVARAPTRKTRWAKAPAMAAGAEQPAKSHPQ